VSIFLQAAFRDLSQHLTLLIRLFG
jgi:hypothetical protein